jgi:hypothetical protein
MAPPVPSTVFKAFRRVSNGDTSLEGGGGGDGVGDDEKAASTKDDDDVAWQLTDATTIAPLISFLHQDNILLGYRGMVHEVNIHVMYIPQELYGT